MVTPRKTTIASLSPSLWCSRTESWIRLRKLRTTCLTTWRRRTWTTLCSRAQTGWKTVKWGWMRRSCKSSFKVLIGCLNRTKSSDKLSTLSTSKTTFSDQSKGIMRSSRSWTSKPKLATFRPITRRHSAWAHTLMDCSPEETTNCKVYRKRCKAILTCKWPCDRNSRPSRSSSSFRTPTTTQSSTQRIKVTIMASNQPRTTKARSASNPSPQWSETANRPWRRARIA